ncbi:MULTISPECIES: ABC transporter ATP-binding protein [unclassified Clostridium]|uniref:ABC transporter ATP-binding protein n=1 Tax=unclassified Clostridium TaxID=2614128 RepID=UPI001A9A7CF6|nr:MULTISPECIES: ABC transporter ATP-binding protein [unclassified Clostridium]
MNVVEVKNVTMNFNLPKEKVDSLKEYFIKLVKHQLMFEKFVALDNVSFEIARGDVFGIVGFNGAGKSTILKIISGIIAPSEGSVVVDGTIAPLIELGAGFDMELTARENVFLNATVLGYSPDFIKSKYDEIIDFAELREFQDVAVKNFSSGMVARLGFAIATVVTPDILIVDEILSVGDYLFQEKCERRIDEMMRGGTTVILVSHAITQIEKLCNRVLWLDHGKVKMCGPMAEVTEQYKHYHK